MSDINFPKVSLQNVYWGKANSKFKIKSEDHKAVVNDTTGDTFYIGSTQYQLLKHEDAIETTEKVINQMGEFGTFTKTVNLWKNDAKMETKWVFPEINYEIGHDDFINPSITIYNSYDGSLRFNASFGALRLVCTNGLTVGKEFVNYKKKHTECLQMEELEHLLKVGMEQFSNETELWKTWLDRETTSEDIKEVQKLFTKKELEQVMQEREIGSGKVLEDVVTFKEENDEENNIIQTPEIKEKLSYWILFNIITQYITHQIENKNRQTHLQNRLPNIFY